MSYITRYNIGRKLWEIGYWVGSQFFVIGRYPNA